MGQTLLSPFVTSVKTREVSFFSCFLRCLAYETGAHCWLQMKCVLYTLPPLDTNLFCVIIKICKTLCFSFLVSFLCLASSLAVLITTATYDSPLDPNSH